MPRKPPMPAWRKRALSLLTWRKLPRRVTSWDVKGMTYLDPDIAIGDRRRKHPKPKDV
jgi:hypothetical protein